MIFDNVDIIIDEKEDEGVTLIEMIKGAKGDTGFPTDEQVTTAVEDILEQHPEWTTTVEDGSISEEKLSTSLSETISSISDKADSKEINEQLVSGTTLQLNTTRGETDSTPYKMRKSLAIGNRLRDKLIGGSVGFNQLVLYGGFESATDWKAVNGTIAVSNNKCVYTAGSDVSTSASIYRLNVSSVPNHRFFITATLKSSKATTVKIQTAGGNYTGSLSANVRTELPKVMVLSADSSYIQLYLNINSNLAENDTVTIENVMIIDLTVMFGSTIADYIYTLEQSSAGSGISWIKSYGFFDKPYYPYSSTIKSVNVAEHIMVGENAWDEEWELGTLPNPSSTTQIRSKNYINILPDVTYFWGASVSNGMEFYDSNYNHIDYSSVSFYGYVNSNSTFQSPANARYMKFWLPAVYGTIYKYDICINVSNTAINGQYFPHKSYSYPIPQIDLRGILKLIDNELVYDGDVFDENRVTRKYGIVDLGTLTWSKLSNNIFISTSLNSIAKVDENSVPLCSKYQGVAVTEDNTTAGNNPDKSICYRYPTFDRIYVRDDTLASGTADAFKTAVSGVYLVYELATPIVEEYTKVKIKDLTWTYNSTYSLFESSVSSVMKPAQNTIGNIFCSGYQTIASKSFDLWTSLDKVINLKFASNGINIKDTTYNTVSAFLTAQGEKDIFFASAKGNTSFNPIQVCDKYGTEQYVSEIPVGHETLYQIDFIEELDSADIPQVLENISDLNEDMTSLKNGNLDVNQSVSAKSLDSISGTEQTTPFIFQRSSGAVAKYLEKRGNSVVVNQLVNKASFPATQTISQVTFTNNGDGSITVNGTANGDSAILQFYVFADYLIAGHKYLFKFNNATSFDANFYIAINRLSENAGHPYTTDFIVEKNSYAGSTPPRMSIVVANGKQVNNVKITPICIDLTLWFNGNIPQSLLDHPETFPQYYTGSLAYNVGTLVNANATELVNVEENQWDEVWELGALNTTTGQDSSSDSRIRSKNYIPVLPNTQYYFSTQYSASALYMIPCYYDKDYNFISATVGGVFSPKSTNYTSANNPFTTPENARYIRFYVNTTYGTTYKNDICINISNPKINGTYFPYIKHTYSLGNEVLRSAGNVCDIKEYSGKITRYVGEVDLGTLTWELSSTVTNGFVATGNMPSDWILPANGSAIIKAICSKGYRAVSTNEWQHTSNPDKVMAYRIPGSGKGLAITDSAFSGYTKEQVKTALSGVYLFYEVATPTTEQGTPLTLNIEVGSTMSYNSSIPQGQKVFFQNDIREFSDDLGQLANWDAFNVAMKETLGGVMRNVLAIKDNVSTDTTAWVDLSTLDYAKASNNRFTASVPNIYASPDNNTLPKAIMSDGEYVAKTGNTYIQVNKSFYISTDKKIAIRNTSITTVEDMKKSLVNVLLAYEKA